MNFNYDISIIVPGIRKENWNTLFEHMKFACKKYSYELIFSSPYALPENLQKEPNVKYVKSFGSPTRSLQMGMLIAEGRFFTWISDDSHLYPDSIDGCADLLLSKNPSRDIVTVRYCEGVAHSAGEFPMDYWRSGYHGDLRQPGIDPNMNFACVMFLSQECYRYFGCLDQRFEHINMNVIDFTFRAQKSGESKLYMSPTQIMNCDFEPDRNTDNSPVIQAYWENDRPLFYDMYKDNTRETFVDPEGWRKTEVVWKRRKF